MENIKKKILVLSGKGGVGKSTVSVNFAVWLSMQNKNVGLLDIDIHGPSIPKLLSLDKEFIQGRDDKIEPVIYSDTLKIMSIGFLLPDDSKPVIWRGPMKHNMINQFTKEVNWGNLDFMVVDCPPGTGDELLSIAQSIGDVDGVIVVTTPQQISVIDVKKCISFCKQMNLPVLGIVENMSGFVCPECNKRIEIFKGEGGQEMAEKFGVPFLGKVPLGCEVVTACDSGRPIIEFDKETQVAISLDSAFKSMSLTNKSEANENETGDTNIMKIAIPLTNGVISSHFGHCEQFAIIDVDKDEKKIINVNLETPPPHEPGLLPKWLNSMGVNIIVAGGMGQRAQQLFSQNQIEVVVGASSGTPEEIVSAYLNKTLQTGENICDH